jgi:citrate synthase
VLPETNRRTDVISVAEAAAQLGIKPATVYAYISRGLLSSARLPHDRRSWLSRAEVEEFSGRRGARSLAAPAVLHEQEREGADRSTVGWLHDDRLYYRGADAAELAMTLAYDEVAELLWSGERGPGQLRQPSCQQRASIRQAQDAMPDTSLPMDRLKVTVMLLGAADLFRYDLSRPSVLSAARTLAPAFVEALPGSRRATGGGITGRLWARLTGTDPSSEQLRLLSATLILLADHGIGPSTRAAREAAALEADPYSVVLAGMSVASGLLLGGGSSVAVQSWLGEIDSVDSVSRVLGDRLVRGDRVTGFGQPRYRGPDQRAELLLGLLAASQGDEDRQRIVRTVIASVYERRGLAPNVEFALGALCFVHDMPRGAGEAIFVIARTAGWIAHAIEVYENS